MDSVLNLTKVDGSVEQQRLPISHIALSVRARQLVAVSDNIAELTRLTELRLHVNAFEEIPSGVFFLTRLTLLDVSSNRLAAIPREIGRLKALTQFYVANNQLAALPCEIGQLTALRWLDLSENALPSLPAELGQLRLLKWLNLLQNRLAWLPSTFARLPASTKIFFTDNPHPLDVGGENVNWRPLLPALFAATTELAMIRHEATTLVIGLQDLELPALVTLEILDAALENSIPMHKKWDLVVAVKHFHERRAQ